MKIFQNIAANVDIQYNVYIMNIYIILSEKSSPKDCNINSQLKIDFIRCNAILPNYVKHIKNILENTLFYF
ncbi:unnamed protein product [Commensalibacter papalotli (ex Botero et al. 2024)]|uniref:Uncharacterized protein n=1 Tax=Commensalibacter papalotli (ex Botero et al. 2024) TaxID=2972766 RepID=A0ABM9HKF5_9PROT|nr:unnamed protein product [Commensalibacter papalotli (ex Botero et al. 2024)]CAI3947906.1 unnamed protein product [Commensalibacter papalotli (ex Botero et al. 2024)]